MNPMQEGPNLCEECQLELAGLEPGESLSNDVALHLAGCAECQEIAEVLRGNAIGLGALRDEEIPVPVKLVEVPAKVVAMPARSGRWRWAAVAAAAMLVGAVSLWQVDEEPIDAEREGTELAEVVVVPDLNVPSVPTGKAAVRQAGNAAEQVESHGNGESASRGEAVAVEMPRRPEPVAAPVVSMPVAEKVVAAATEAEVGPVDLLAALESPVDPFAAFSGNSLGIGLEAGNGDVSEAAEEAPDQTVIKLLTPDPNVVIYWIVENQPVEPALPVMLDGNTNNL